MTVDPKVKAVQGDNQSEKVDQEFERAIEDLSAIIQQRDLYKKKFESSQTQYSTIKQKYRQLLEELTDGDEGTLSPSVTEEATVEDYEAIISQSIVIASQVINEITRISIEARQIHEEISRKVRELEEVLDGLKFPEIPEISFISNDQDTPNE